MFLDKYVKGYNPLDPNKYRKYNAYRPEGAKTLFYYVPFTSVTFSFKGEVYGCAYNRDIQIGQYPENSIKEILEGNPLREIKDRMEHNDLSKGCQYCKHFFNRGKYTGLKPQVFDRYSDYKSHPYPLVLEFELSNVCILECVMCYGEVSSSIRKNRDKLPAIKSPYDDVSQLKPYLPKLKEAKFHGGEPFLIPVYYKTWDNLLAVSPNVNIFVITNATQSNERIIALLQRGDFDIAV